MAEDPGSGEDEATVESQSSLSSDSRHRQLSQHGASSPVVQDLDIEIEEITPQIAQKISRMEVVNPEVLRVTRAFQALQQFAAPLRVGVNDDFYHKSYKSEKISTFWSHSWHGGHWKKILTLITFYNGMAAVSLGLLTGVVMCVLFSFQFLPGIERDWYSLEFSVWSTFCGFLVTVSVTLLWRSQSPVFLDRICISQNDNELKSAAIFSLAGLLKKSDTMLILWDPTWTDRLWCLFELAAFLKSKENREKALVVRPIFLGPISIAVFILFFAAMIPALTVPIGDATDIILTVVLLLLCGLIVAFFAASSLRNYFRDLDVMKQQMLAISFNDTRSACCDQNHIDPSGVPLLCDRKIVKQCVNIWFGSQQAFEEKVRSEVLDILNRDLTERVFSTRWCLGVTSPFLLAFVDLSATFSFDDLSKGTFASLAFLLEGLVVWAVVLPGVKDLLIQLCRLLRSRPESQLLEVMKTFATVSVCACPLVLLLVVYLLTRFTHLSILPGATVMHSALAFTAGALLLTACNVSLGIGLKALLRCPGW